MGYREWPSVKEDLALLGEDWATLAHALEKTFPTAKYAEGLLSSWQPGNRQPLAYKPEWRSSLLQVDCYEIFMSIDAGWTPIWVRTTDNSAWILSKPAAPLVRIHRTDINKSDDGGTLPPCIGAGYMMVHYEKENPGHCEIYEQLRSLLSSVARNHGFVRIEFPSYQTKKPVVRPSRFWTGRAAIAWLNADWRRMTHYYVAGKRTGLRPAEGQMPPPEAVTSSEEGLKRYEAAKTAYYKKTLPSPRSRFRIRHIAMLRNEWVRFADALEVEFPEMRFFPGLDWRERKADAPPELRIGNLRHFLTHGDKPPRELNFCFDPDWRPEWYRKNDQWHFRFPENPTGSIQGEGFGELRRGNPQDLSCAYIYLRCRRDHKEDLALANRVYKLLCSFSTNRDQVHFRLPFLEIEAVKRKGSELWIGHDAIRWAQQNPMRFIFGTRPFGSDMPVSEYADGIQMHRPWQFDHREVKSPGQLY